MPIEAQRRLARVPKRHQCHLEMAVEAPWGRPETATERGAAREDRVGARARPVVEVGQPGGGDEVVGDEQHDGRHGRRAPRTGRERREGQQARGERRHRESVEPAGAARHAHTCARQPLP
jgi:hypothetical protein